QVVPDPNNSRGVKRIVFHPPAPPTPTPGAPPVPDRANALWLDRARVFQTAMSVLTGDFGTGDSAINDVTPENAPLGAGSPPPDYPLERSVNYCERQGRCNVGCLPGARHTLNKQLMLAILGKFDPAAPDDPTKDVKPLLPNLSLETLAE